MKESEGWLRLAEWIAEQPQASIYLCNVLKHHWQMVNINIPSDTALRMMDRLRTDILESNVGTVAQGSTNPFYWFDTEEGSAYEQHHNQQRLLYCLFMAEQTKRLKS